MTNYSLTLYIDPVDLGYIKAAGERIMLAKPVNGETANVIWLSIDPFQSTTIEWTEEYWIYASTTEVTPGEQIYKLSEVSHAPAQDGGSYSFTSAANFSPFEKDKSIPVGTFSTTNTMPYEDYPALTFGLAQSALVNKKRVERKPISAQSVLAQQTIQMTPFTSVYVWLQSQFASESMITTITGKRSVAKFGGSTSEISRRYDPIKGVFTSL